MAKENFEENVCVQMSYIRQGSHICMYRHIHMHTNVHTSELGKETNPNLKAHSEDQNWCCMSQCGCPRSQVTKEGSWLLISLAHKVTSQMRQAQMLAAFLYQFYSILGELASTIHMSSFRHCDQGQALELPGHIWYQLRGKALAPRNSASSTLGSLFL